jgi:hypothetical protein
VKDAGYRLAEPRVLLQKVDHANRVRLDIETDDVEAEVVASKHWLLRGAGTEVVGARGAVRPQVLRPFPTCARTFLETQTPWSDTMQPLMTDLPSFDDDGNLQVVVESPRGSTLKIDYDEEHGLFTVARSLPLGVSYPYDFGFVPSTRAEDGDPIDVMTLHDHATYPGSFYPAASWEWFGYLKRVNRESARTIIG